MSKLTFHKKKRYVSIIVPHYDNNQYTDIKTNKYALLDHNLYNLTIPGGGIEDGETPSEAAARELYEEVGIAISTSLLILIDYRICDDHGEAYSLYTFYLKQGYFEKDIFNKEPNKHASTFFCSIDEIKEKYKPSQYSKSLKILLKKSKYLNSQFLEELQ